MSFDPSSAVEDGPQGFDPSTASFDPASATPEPRRGGTRAEAPKPYVPAEDGMRPGEAGQGRGLVNPEPAVAPPAQPELRQGPGAVLANVRENVAARDQRLNAPKPAPGSRSVFDGAPVQVPEQTGGFPPQEMAEGSVAPWKLDEQRRMGEYVAPTRPAEAKPFGVGENIAQDLRESTRNPLARGTASAFSNLAQTGTGLVRLTGDLFGLDSVRDFAAGAEKIASTVEKGATSDLKGNDKLAADVMASIGVSAPSVALGYVGGPALRTLFVQSALSEYGNGRDAGFGVAESAARSGIYGTAEALGERFGFGEQIRLLKSVTRGLPQNELAKVLGSMIAKEIPGEQLTTAMQFLADKIGPAALNPNASVADYLNAAGETLKVTIAQTAVMGGGPAAINTVRNELAAADRATERSAMSQAERAAKDAGFLRPTERRRAANERLDDFAAEHGIKPAFADAAKKEAEGMPLAEVPGFYKRFMAAITRRLGRQADDAMLGALDEPKAPEADEAPAPKPAAPNAPTTLADRLGDRFGLNDAPAGAAVSHGTTEAQQDTGPVPASEVLGTPMDEKAPPAPSTSAEHAGEPINRNWTAFAPESGSLNIPREQLPQIQAEHRGALVNFLAARGITHESAEVPADSLKPTQGEFSPRKVQQAREYQGGDRSILVSSDGYVLDGTHQWAASLAENGLIKIIKFDAPIHELIRLAHAFPSSSISSGALSRTRTTDVQPRPQIGQLDSAPLQSSQNGSALSAKSVGNGVATETLSKQGLGGFDVPGRRSVLSHVVNALQDLKIRDRVVELVPVNVVHILAGKQGTPKVLLHDPAVLKDVLSLGEESAIAGRRDAADALVRAVARAAAERGVSTFGGSPAREGDAAVVAGKINSTQVSTPSSIDERGASSGATDGVPTTVSKYSSQQAAGAPEAAPVANGVPSAGNGAAPVAPAPSATPRVIARAGRTPNAAQPIELRPNADGTLTPFMEGKAMLDFESGNPITLPAGVSDVDAKKAIRAAGAVSNKTNFFGPAGAVAAEPSAETPAAPAAADQPSQPAPESPRSKQDQRAARARARMALDTANDSVLQALAKMGGIRRDVVASEFGLKPEELKHTVKVGGLNGFPFRKNGGMDLDRALTNLREAGYFPGVAEEDVRAAFEAAIYDEIGGGRNLTAQGQMADAQRQAEERAQEEEAAARAEYDAEAQAEREAIMAEAGVSEEGMATLTDDDIDLDAKGNASTEAFMRAMGESEQEIADAIAQEQANRRAAQGNRQEAGHAAGEEARAPAGTRSDETRPGAAEDQGLNLTAPTKAQVLAQQAAIEKEQADREAPADQPRDQRTADQVDLFNTQGSIFDQQADSAPAETPAAAETKPQPRPENLIALRKRASVLKSLLECLSA